MRTRLTNLLSSLWRHTSDCFWQVASVASRRVVPFVYSPPCPYFQSQYRHLHALVPRWHSVGGRSSVSSKCTGCSTSSRFKLKESHHPHQRIPEDQNASLSRLETHLIRCVTLDFRAASLACRVLHYFYRGRLCDGLENLDKRSLTFTIFPSEMCHQAGFFDGGETALRPVFRSHFRNLLATTSSICRTNVSLLPKRVSVSNGIQGHCFDTMSLLRLTLLRLGNVAPISVCLNALPKMGPGAARPLCFLFAYVCFG